MQATDAKSLLYLDIYTVTKSKKNDIRNCDNEKLSRKKYNIIQANNFQKVSFDCHFIKELNRNST